MAATSGRSGGTSIFYNFIYEDTTNNGIATNSANKDPKGLLSANTALEASRDTFG